jgi:phosphate transport system substrate-binding protein
MRILSFPTRSSWRSRGRAIPIAIALILLQPSHTFAAQPATPGSPDSSLPAVTAAGSATLGPVLETAAEHFAADAPDISVVVDRTNSGDGIERFCAGETDIATSGRTIRDEEATTCDEVGVEFEVAFDGVAVVVNPATTAVTCLTVDQLARIWEPGSTVDTWADVNASLPDEPLTLYGTGAESGTYQFFTQVTVGEEGVSRDDYTVTEAHPETADRVAEDPNGLGFLPYPRYVENQDRLTLLGVDEGDGCVKPSPASIQDGTYAPLSRPMYIYVSHAALTRPEVQAYLTFWFADAAALTEEAGLVPSSDGVYADNVATLEAHIAGTSGTATPAM